MTDHVVRVLDGDELRRADALFHRAMHSVPCTDEQWKFTGRTFQPGRTLGVFDNGLIGTARSIDAELVVPGGTRVPAAQVTGVAVRSDRTRRGVLTELMRTQLTELAARGVVATSLLASEGGIYARFGYGPATGDRTSTVDRRRAVLRPGVPAGGEVELLDPESGVDELKAIYDRLPLRRPGMVTRGPHWWPSLEGDLNESKRPTVAVHRGENGGDGFVVFRVDHSWTSPSKLIISDLHAADSTAFAGLWRYLLTVDLVDVIENPDRPHDEPIELMFTDPRMVTVTGADDGTWLRLVNVEAALAARAYDGEPLVLEVTDPVLPANSGRYLLGAGGARRTDAEPQLKLGMDALAMIYLGNWRPSALALGGLIQSSETNTLDRANRLFCSADAPWCGTFF